MFDLTYLLGTWKKVATGVGGEGDGGRTIGGSTRLANILDVIDELVVIMKVFEIQFSLSQEQEGRRVGRTIEHSQLL
jgi:hypothetical protein